MKGFSNELSLAVRVSDLDICFLYCCNKTMSTHNFYENCTSQKSCWDQHIMFGSTLVRFEKNCHIMERERGIRSMHLIL